MGCAPGEVPALEVEPESKPGIDAIQIRGRKGAEGFALNAHARNGEYLVAHYGGRLFKAVGP